MENRGALVVGVSHDTPAFAAHAIAHWWHQEGSTRYRGSRQLLILADTGGSNSCRCRAWKTELQSQLANSFALAVTVQTNHPSNNEVGLDVSHHTHLSLEGTRKYFFLDILSHRMSVAVWRLLALGANV
jgi:hypothetical protein